MLAYLLYHMYAPAYATCCKRSLVKYVISILLTIVTVQCTTQHLIVLNCPRINKIWDWVIPNGLRY